MSHSGQKVIHMKLNKQGSGSVERPPKHKVHTRRILPQCSKPRSNNVLRDHLEGAVSICSSTAGQPQVRSKFQQKLLSRPHDPIDNQHERTPSLIFNKTTEFDSLPRKIEIHAYNSANGPLLVLTCRPNVDNTRKEPSSEKRIIASKACCPKPIRNIRGRELN